MKIKIIENQFLFACGEILEIYELFVDENYEKRIGSTLLKRFEHEEP